MSPDYNSSHCKAGDTGQTKGQLQFSLRGLFLVTTICAIGLSFVVSFPDFFLNEIWLTLLIAFWPLFYLLPSLVLCGPVWWFGRKCVSHWYKWEFLVLIVPYLVWASLTIIDGSGKSLANVAYEPLLLAFASVLAPLMRITLAKTTIAPRPVALVALLAICAVAVAL